MNLEKIGYSLLGSLIAGSVIQKNMGLEQQYFFVISIGLWAICVGIQRWNCKREQRIRDKFEVSNSENRDAIVNKILDIISETSERQIACIKEEIGKLTENQMSINKNLIESLDKVYGLLMNTNDSIEAFCKTDVCKFDELISSCKTISTDLQASVCELDKKLIGISQINKKIMDTVPVAIAAHENNIILSIEKETNDRQKLLEDRFANVATLLNSIIELNNSIVENIKAIEKVSVENKDCVCDEIVTLKELVEGNEHDAIVKLGEATDKVSKDICSQLAVQSNSVQELLTEKLAYVSKQNEYMVSTMKSGTEDAIDQIIMLKDEVEVSKVAVNETIENEQKAVISKLSELMNLFNTINEDTKGNLSEIYKDLCGILSNLQSVLDATDSKISSIQNTDSSMYDLLEDAKNKLHDVESAIGDGTEKIEEAMSESMERQKEIVTEEQSILGSYNDLLSRINDEVIVKLINDSNTLLKCMKDCYNLLDSQRRAKK